jgi:hypothetical protein
VRATRVDDASDTHASWTTDGGLFVLPGLQPASYRVEIGLGPGASPLATQTVDASRQSYVLIFAPLP